MISSDYYCEIIDFSSRTCKLCLPNYSFNDLGQCDQFKVGGCSSGFNNPEWHFPFDLNIAEDPAVFFPQRTQEWGCSSCESGFTRVRSTFWNNHICARSERLANKRFGNELWVKNCSVFDIQKSTLICSECNVGYVLVFPSGECLQSSILSNCQVAYSQNRCKQCAEGYSLDSVDRCITNLHENCLEILEGSDFSKCIRCKDTFFGHKGVCLKGEISNCKTYHSSSECKECEKGFLLFTFENGSECVQDFSDQECVSKSITQHSYNVTCNECNSHHLLTLEGDTDPFYFYNKINDIANCVLYSNHSNFEIKSFETARKVMNSKFQIEKEYLKLISLDLHPPQSSNEKSVCIKCSPDYYLDLETKSCLLRTQQINNCKSLSSIFDICFECNEGFTLTLDSLNCIPYLKPIENCLQYNSLEECLVCGSGSYPSGSLCVPVPSALRTNHCSDYDANMRCMKCESNFLLVNNQCMQLQVSSCLKYVNHKQCETCMENYILHVQASGNISCEFKSIWHCTKTTELTNAPQSKMFDDSTITTSWCVQCDSGYYPSNGMCLAVAQVIPNCEIYLSSETCHACSSGYILSQNKKKCGANSLTNMGSFSLQNEKYLIDPKCSLMSHLQSPACLLCKSGFILYQGECRPCGGEQCLQCHPRDSRLCQICKPGFSMGENGRCLKV